MVNTDERSKRVRVVKRKKLKVRRAIGLFTVLIMLIGLIPVISITRAAYAPLEVKGTFVNLRTGPGTNYDKAGVVIKADQLEQLDKQGDWYKVKTKSGQVAWVAGWLVSPVKTPLLGPAPVSTGNKVVLKGSFANLRSGPGTTYAKLGTVQKGQELDHVKSEQGWEQVRLADGRLAWIAGWLVTSKTVPVANPIKTAGQSLAATGKATVTGNYVNVRQKANTNSAIVAKASKGEVLTVLGSDEFNWYLIKTSQGKEGWVAGWLIQLSQTPGGQAASGERIVVNGSYVNVRQEPTTSAPIITKVYKGQGYAIKAKQQDWYQIDLAGQEGWIAGWLVQVDKPVTPKPVNVAKPAEPAKPVQPAEADSEAKVEDDKTKEPQPQIDWAKIGGDSVKLRETASSEAKVVTLLARNQVVKVLATEKDWTKVSTEQEQSGYVASWLVKAYTPESTGSAVSKDLTVVLDSGHGGIDPGAVGPTGLKEKDVVFAITERVKEQLEAKGVTVILSRTDDTKIPLNERAAIANREQADLFVSIHCNANTNRNVRGISTYTYAPQTLPELYQMRDERLNLAKVVQQQLVLALGLNDQGVKEANFAVLRSTQMPSILVETAYISNYEEEKLLADQTNQHKAADGIAAGILTYLQID